VYLPPQCNTFGTNTGGKRIRGGTSNREYRRRDLLRGRTKAFEWGELGLLLGIQSIGFLKFFLGESIFAPEGAEVTGPGLQWTLTRMPFSKTDSAESVVWPCDKPPLWSRPYTVVPGHAQMRVELNKNKRCLERFAGAFGTSTRWLSGR